MLNNPNLQSLFDFSEVGSIFDVVGRMETLLEFCEQHPELSGFAPFVKTYLLVTQEVTNQTLEGDQIEDPEELEKLDIDFASRFFVPAGRWINSKEKTTPWSTYMSYCTRKDGIPFLQMMLGINAHINGDLPLSLYETKVKNRNDFLHINKVLLQVIPAVMSNLAFHERDILGLGALITSDFVRSEFQKIVVKWRENAWDNYHLINEDNLSQVKGVLYSQTEEIAEELIRIFHDRSFDNLVSFLDTIEGLSVSLT